jgi:hypothetical protein
MESAALGELVRPQRAGVGRPFFSTPPQIIEARVDSAWQAVLQTRRQIP